jgi:hypothetical protein
MEEYVKNVYGDNFKFKFIEAKPNKLKKILGVNLDVLIDSFWNKFFHKIDSQDLSAKLK